MAIVFKSLVMASVAAMIVALQLALGVDTWRALWTTILTLLILRFWFVYFVMRRPQPRTVLRHLPDNLPDTAHLPTEEKFCLVGAGFSGLAIAAELKRQGVPFDCLEKDAQIGGNWHQGVYHGVHVISSKTTTQYGDYPIPDWYPTFPSARLILDYLNSYAKHFRLFEHIHFNTEVARVDPIGDGEQWKVRLGSGEERTYKGVIICNGHDWDMKVPTYPGNMTIPWIHSRMYKTPDVFAGKRVLVVGGGNSACDIAVAAADSAVSSSICLRRPYWFLPRTMFGRPTAEIFQHWLPNCIMEAIIRCGIWMAYGTYAKLGLKTPDYSLFEHPVSVSGHLLEALLLGRVTVFPDIERIDEGVVTFVDGQKAEFDMVVFATGFNISVPMASHVIEWKNKVPQLLNGVVHPKLRNFFVFGMGQARYGAGPLCTCGAKVLVDTIQVQKSIDVPVGELLSLLGSRPKRPTKITPTDVIIEPHVAFAQAWIGRYYVPTLPYFAKFFTMIGWLPSKAKLAAAKSQ